MYTQHTIPTNPALFLYEFPSPTTLSRHDCHRNDPGASPLPSHYPKHNSQHTALLLFGVANHSSNRQEACVSGCSGLWLTMFPREHAHRTFFISTSKHIIQSSAPGSECTHLIQSPEQHQSLLLYINYIYNSFYL